MGPPRTRAHLLAQRGRFQEGSMNDRASAVPPLQFLDPSERAALERPVPWERQTGRYFAPRPQTDMPVLVGGEDKRGSKMGILGQMWEGMRGKLRIRRDDEKERASFRGGRGQDDDDDDDDNDDAAEERRRLKDLGRGPQPGDDHRPSRDEVYASYHQLVASGFFSSRAIQSSRFGPPRPTTSRGPEGAAPPQWPLTPVITTASQDVAMPHTPVRTSRPGEVCSPVSAASSRGTKRAAADSPPAQRGAACDGNDDQCEEEDDNDNYEDEAEDVATLAHRFLPKRLRKTASRDISLPRMRSVASRKNLRSAVAAARRSLLASAAGAQAACAQHEAADVDMDVAPNDDDHVQPSDGLPRKPVGPGDDALRSETHITSPLGSPPSPSPSPSASSGRKIKHPTRARSLKARGGGDGAASSAQMSVLALPAFGAAHTVTVPLRVVPDANRGIPNVPAIPAKFTYGEDRENDGPWRGLRRG
ncbi:hypothetical protein E4U42_005039 [Claviceps africana]|uniref:Uncharacterized protein n=1 Tax=Claviceps africana TaxID=83212 RepID=A0A8K0JAE4_9HYPO|nr:hypothetical protein E4U42_005039 [Claviceps africana]